MSTRNTVPPKRPRPVMPILWSISAAAYTTAAVAYFLAGKPIIGAIWAVGSLIFWAFTVPMSIRIHRIQLSTWRMLLQAYERRRAVEDRALARLRAIEDEYGWRTP